MFEKIRKQFIIIAMTALAIVMGVLGLWINLANYRMVITRLDDSLNYILEFESDAPDDYEGTEDDIPWAGFPDDYDPEIAFSTRFFTVHYSADMTEDAVHMDHIGAIDEDEAKEAALSVISQGKSSGFYDHYRYLVSTSDDGSWAVFINAAQELHAFKVLAVLTLAVMAAGLFLVFLIVLLLSGYAIRPFTENVEMQRRFITDASHELKTPVTSISASNDVLEMEFGENEWITNIRQQTEHLTDLISRLVMLSRLDESKSLTEKCEFSLSDMLWEIAEGFERQARAKGKKIGFDIDEDVKITGDEMLIGQMISVLLDNAVKYSDAEGNIQVSLHKVRHKAVLTVSNTFEGPHLKDVGRLFDRFYRPDEARSSADGGSGIGLSIAKSVVRAHGGQITAGYSDKNRIFFKAVL